MIQAERNRLRGGIPADENGNLKKILIGEAFLQSYNPPPHVCKVVRAIINCRRAELGGHADICDECGYQHISYNSCRNRHCPKCQALTKERWIMARQDELLPVPYFHVVFTLPGELYGISFQNQQVIYDLLLNALPRQSKSLRKIKGTWVRRSVLHRYCIHGVKHFRCTHMCI